MKLQENIARVRAQTNWKNNIVNVRASSAFHYRNDGVFVGLSWGNNDIFN